MNLFDFDYGLGEGSKIIFFDTETTGRQKDAQIIEIGAIVEDESQNYELYNTLCATTNGKLIDLEAMATHGIRNEDLAGKREFVKTDFYSKIGELNSSQNYLVAHNIGFDLSRLEYYGFENRCQLIDTLQCAKHLIEIGEPLGEYEYPLPNYKLQTLRYALFNKEQEESMANKYGVTIEAHNAIGDVVVLKMLFEVLLEMVCKKEHLLREDAIKRLAILSKEPVMVKSFAFGKYKGRLIAEILREDSGYLQWLYKDMKKRKESGDEVDENLFITLQNLLEKK